jgi:hypothetical protein
MRGKHHMRGGQNLPAASLSLMNAREGAGATRLSREGLAHAVRSGDCESRVRHGSGAGVPRRPPRLACVRYRRGQARPMIGALQVVCGVASVDKLLRSCYVHHAP